MGIADENDDLEHHVSGLAVSGRSKSLDDDENEVFHDSLEANEGLPSTGQSASPYFPKDRNPDHSDDYNGPMSPTLSTRDCSPLSSSLMYASYTSQEKPIPRNVSFIHGTGKSVAYKEHNPPAILRQTNSSELSEPAEPPTALAVPQAVPPTGERKDGDQQQSKAKAKVAKDKRDELHILIGVTGSVATIKVGPIIHKLKQIYRERAIIQLVATKASCVFFKPADVPRDVKIWYDEDEWKSRDGKPDSSLHMELRRWADILLVAPCSANTLAKLTYGICDNLLTSVFRVWNPAVPMLIAPAMNTHMYTNPVTKRHFKSLKDWYPFVEILKPVEKVLVCGDIGMGGMREWTDIVQILVKRLGVTPEDVDEDEDS